jgi:hypothetical protein
MEAHDPDCFPALSAGSRNGCGLAPLGGFVPLNSAAGEVQENVLKNGGKGPFRQK